VQQTLQKAFTHLYKFEERSSFSTWLTRIGINEALLLLRKRRGLRETFIDDLSGDDETTTVPEFADSSPDPEVNYSRREREKILSSSLKELSRGTRTAIQLRELDERSTEETARIMGISVGCGKGASISWAKEIAAGIEGLCEIDLEIRKKRAISRA
jgi:RNA polymerase sigma-70 factor (ECF subfamily)